MSFFILEKPFFLLVLSQKKDFLPDHKRDQGIHSVHWGINHPSKIPPPLFREAPP